MYFNRIFEFTKVIDTDEFNKIINSVYRNLEEVEDGYADYSVSSKGITVLYRDSQYRKKITVIVNAALLVDCNSDADVFLVKLNKCCCSYFKRYALDDFTLMGFTAIADINVGRDKVGDYIAILKRIGKVKGFTPTDYDGIKGFCLDGNSNNTLFKIYDLEHCVRKYTDNSSKCFSGILRTEVKLTKAKAIGKYTDGGNTTCQTAELWNNSQEVFMDTFVKIVPFGDFYKKDAAVEIICKNVTDLKSQRRMLWLVELIPAKKSLLLAQKALGYRKIECIMNLFAEINLSPVTISKRCSVKWLEGMYSFLV